MGITGTSKKKSLILIFAFVVFAVFITMPIYAVPALECDLDSGSCPVTRPINVFKMQFYSNSHAGINTSAYTNSVCCGVTEGGDLSVMNHSYSDMISNKCDPQTMGRVISISKNTNAHVAEYGFGINYENNICLSSTSGNISCEAKSSSCNADEQCLASFTDINNAHIGNCSEYATKICCKLIPNNVIIISTLPGDLDIRVGEIGMFVFNITNSGSQLDFFTLELSGTPSKIGYWSWFNNHRYDNNKNTISLTLESGKTINVAVLIFGGEANLNGVISVTIKSALTGGSTELLKNVRILYGAEGFFTETPEFGWSAYFLMAIIVAVFLL